LIGHQEAKAATRSLLPSEGKGHTFESCRVRHEINSLMT